MNFIGNWSYYSTLSGITTTPRHPKREIILQASEDNKKFTIDLNEFPPLHETVIGNNRKVNEIGEKEASNKVNTKVKNPSGANATNNCTETTNIINRTSKRIRRPKVFTPNSHENNVYCLCQREDTEWYLVCSLQTDGC